MKEVKALILICTPMFIAAKTWTQPKYLDKWIENIWYTHTHTHTQWNIQFNSVQFSRSVMSDSLRPHESQHARPPCPSPTPGVHPDSRPSSQWCHPAISSSVVPFSSCPQSLPALLSHKKEWNHAICNNIDGLRGYYYAKWNKSKEKKTIMYDFITCGSYETKLMNKCNKTETEYKYRRQRGGCQRWGE